MSSYPATYYSATRVASSSSFGSLQQNVQADICIIGGGLAGLTTAWELLKRNKSVVVLEKNKVGWGASGRNGGFCLNGWSEGLSAIERRSGLDDAKKLFALSVEGVEIVRENIEQNNLPDCNIVKGKLSVVRYEAGEQLQRYRDRMAQHFNYEYEYLDRAAIREKLNTPVYKQALRDNIGFHFHPLNYALGLADLIRAKGGQIFEDSAMQSFSPVRQAGATHRYTVKTAAGAVQCDDVVLCCGGYGGAEFGRLRSSFLPIATYVVLTERLGSRLQDFIRTTDAVGDDRRSSDYYRVVEGDRILWGGRITTKNEQNEARLSAILRKDMGDVFAGLKDVKIEKAWSGLMGYSRHKMPHVAQIGHGLWACSSFGGHGMNTTAIGGRVVAEALSGESDRIRLFKPYGLTWNGGIFGPVAAETVYRYLRLMDYFQEGRYKGAHR
ncbi:NAD(P)/FAD-dependent oxidoreductase [Pseudochrobactrum sp. HB0163]|uniref:NAD(P)/FAD-dependent oxidoreductase n=1 Tax=Pseudochrobactrum sp. HB0163 TaxID=3450708 RepID=UPI003F6E1F4F